MNTRREIVKAGAASLEYAPKMLWPNPNPPTAAEYAAAGWLPVVDEPPAAPAPTGYHYEPRGWELTPQTSQTSQASQTIKRVYAIIADPPAPPRTFSKLKLYAVLSAAGLWDTLKTWLESQTYEGVNAWTAFSLAQDLSEGNEMFGAWFAAAKTALGVTDEQAETILAQCVAEADA